jgi:hypothetical protein
MKKFTIIAILAFSLTIGCTKTETPETTTTTSMDSCKMQIDSLKAEIAELKKNRTHRTARLQAAKVMADTTIVQKTAHQIHEEQDEANEADHQTLDTAGQKVIPIPNGVIVEKTKDTVVKKKNIFQKIIGIFKK